METPETQIVFRQESIHSSTRLESQTRAGQEIMDSARYYHLAGRGCVADMSGDLDGGATGSAGAGMLAFAYMNAGADGQPEAADAIYQRSGTANGTLWSVEHSEQRAAIGRERIASKP